MQFYQTTTETLKTENIIFGNISQKTVPNVNPPSVYNEIAIEYNYGDADNQLRAPFLWELPEVTTTIGISESDIGGRKKFSIPISLNPIGNEEHKKCISLMDSTYKTCADLIFKNRASLKLPHFMKENPEGSNFKHPVYYPRDKVTLEIIPGKSPSMYLQLSIRKDSKTMFCGLDEKPISWELLKNVQMNFIPLVHFEKIYVGGGKPSLQMKLVSGIVTSVMSKSSVVRQKSTIERLRQSKPELFQNVSKQIEELKHTSNDTVIFPSQEDGGEEATEEESGDLVDSPPKAKSSKFSAPPKVGANRLQDFLKP
jgi:hypothetical protein